MSDEMIAKLDERVTNLETYIPAVAALKIQMDACELLHQETRAVAERTEAALNNNTKASEEQTKAITDLTVIVRAVVNKVENHDPVVNRSRVFQKWWDRMADWFDINRIAITFIGKWVITPILTLGAFAVALKQLGVW